MNIVMFVLDQLSFRALNAYGNRESHTPNIDSIRDRGVAAEACYCPYPLCQPARASIWSGQYNHRTRVWSNGRKWPIERMDETYPALGEVFSREGYDTFHFGKKHDGGSLRGFVCSEELELKIPDEDPRFPFNMDTYADEYTVREVEKFLQDRSSKRPIFLVVDLINPHNICGWIGRNRFAHEPLIEEKELPLLPPNFDFSDISNRPSCIKYVCCSHIRQSQTVGWSPENFREYITAYYYYLSRADSDIGRVMNALSLSSIDLEDTVFVVTSDHGDNMAARGSVTKQVSLYEEVTRVPLILAGRDIPHRAELLKGVCSSLDIFPTLMSLAGIENPGLALDGIDISSAFGSGVLPARDYVESEWFTEWGYTISPGRMIRSGNVKYIHYLEGDAEELYFLDRDPYEMHNAAFDADAASELERMRKLFRKYLAAAADPYLSLEVKADKRWRSHKVGYQNHEGLSAPEAER